MKVLVRVQLASLSEGGNGKRGLKSDYGQIKGDREAGEDSIFSSLFRFTKLTFLLCSGFLFSLFSSSTDIIWGAPFWNRIISLLLAVSLPVLRI
jgi:hypothetical protein